MSGFITRWNKFLNTSMRETFDALSLLALRVICGGGLALVHGWDKLNNFSTMSASFPDPLHIGNSSMSLMLTIFGELICGLFVAFGFFTRIFAIPPLITMLVAICIIHAQDPYQIKE